MSAADFATRLRNRERIVGIGRSSTPPFQPNGSPTSAGTTSPLDLQHGLIGYDGMLRGLQAIDSATGPAGVVRVEADDPTYIGKALDAGARMVIVPLIDSAEDAARAVVGDAVPAPRHPVLRADALTASGRARARRRQSRHRSGGDDRDSGRVGERGGHLRRDRPRRRVCRPVRPAARRRRSSTTDVSVDDAFEAALVRIQKAAAAAGIAAGFTLPPATPPPGGWRRVSRSPPCRQIWST